MSHKKVGKHRIDKYYHLAAKTGYRARSAYKLIHLNSRYNFLPAPFILDLCSAPGSWLQVCASYNPKLLVGVDLNKIQALPNVTTVQADITTNLCYEKLNDILSNYKLNNNNTNNPNNTNNTLFDLILHDGAPNLGTNWHTDAFRQNELVLQALKLANTFIKPGGTFISKVFRSKDYSSLLFVFNKLFKTVHVTKPLSSRAESAEIFVVGEGFNRTTDLDFFNPRKVFSDDECKLSVKKLFKVEKGWDIKLVSFDEFLNSKELMRNLIEGNKVDVPDEFQVLFEQETLALLNDLRVVGWNELKKVVRKRDVFVRKIMKFKDEDFGDLNDDSFKNEVDNINNEEKINENSDNKNKDEKFKQAIEKVRAMIKVDEESLSEEGVVDDKDWKVKMIENEIKRKRKKEKKEEERIKLVKAKLGLKRKKEIKDSEDKENNCNNIENNVIDKDNKVNGLEANEHSDSTLDSSESFDLNEKEISEIVNYKQDPKLYSYKSINRNLNPVIDLPAFYIKEQQEMQAEIDVEYLENKTLIKKASLEKKELEAKGRRARKAKRKVQRLLSRNEFDEMGKKQISLRKVYKKTKKRQRLVRVRKGMSSVRKGCKLVDKRMKAEKRKKKK